MQTYRHHSTLFNTGHGLLAVNTEKLVLLYIESSKLKTHASMRYKDSLICTTNLFCNRP